MTAADRNTTADARRQDYEQQRAADLDAARLLRTPDTPTASDTAAIGILADIPTAWNGDTPWKYLMDQGDAEVALLKLREAGYIVVDHNAMKAAAMADLSELERQIDTLTAERDAAVARADALTSAMPSATRLLNMANNIGDQWPGYARMLAAWADRGTDR